MPNLVTLEIHDALLRQFALGIQKDSELKEAIAFYIKKLEEQGISKKLKVLRDYFLLVQVE